MLKKNLLKGKAKLLSLLALIATVVCAVLMAFTGLFGGFGAGVQTANANATGTAYTIGGTNGTFDANGLKQLMGQIMGKPTASYNELKAFIDKQPDKQFESSLFNNGNGYFTVNLGGLTWNVVFASEDTSGEVVVTLWQASSDLHAQWSPWYSTDKTLNYPSNMYGTSFIRASLVNSQYAARAITETTPGMSGSGSGWNSNRKFMDYINTTNAVERVTKTKINRTTGLPVMSGDAEATMEVEVPVNQVYQTYHPIVTNYGEYLDTPSQMPWQWYQSTREIYGTAWWGDAKSDGLFGNKSGGLSDNPGGWWSPADDYTGKNGYSNWGGDKIWLPSAYEVGFNNTDWASGGCIYPNPSARSGFWGLPSAARQNATTAVTQDEITAALLNNHSNYTDGSGNPATNGQSNMDNSSWLRSGNNSNANYAYSVNSGGSGSSCGVTDLRAVRPALHLNLKSAASAAGLVVEAPEFDTTANVTLSNNNTVATLEYSGAAKEINLTTPATGVSVTVTAPATYANGKVSVTDAGTYTVTLSADAGYGWSDGSVGSKTLMVVVKPKAITALTWKNGATTLTGNPPEIAYTGAPIIIGASFTGVGSPAPTVNLPVVYAGDNISAGTFTATAINNNPNYSIATNLLSKDIQITPKAVTPVWDTATGATITYDGENHAPTAWYIAATGEKIYLPVTLMKEGGTVGTYDVAATEAVSAGKYRATVAAAVYNGNYEVKTAATLDFEVEKVLITANDVEWNFVSGAKFAPGATPAVQALFRFNNQAYVLDLDFTTTSGSTTDWTVGDYTVAAKLGTDAKFANFALSGTISRDLRITDSATGTYTVIWEGFSSVITYNGQNQKPTAYIIVDGEKLAVNVGIKQTDGTVSATAQAKNAGTYTYVASLAGYTLDNEEVTQRIDPRTISVVYTNLTGLQHGALDGSNNPVTVTASTLDPVALLEFNANELNFAVTGGSNLAGTRVVSVEAQSKDAGGNWVACGNYVISNASAVQTVSKKVLTDNDITWTPNGLTFTYDGNIKIPAGTVKTTALAGGDTGSVYVIFEFVYAVEVGTYQVKVLGISNDNYTFEGTKTVTITADGTQSVQWEGVQNGGSVVYNGGNQLPKPYIVIDGEKVYLEVSSLTRDGVTATEAIRAGSYVATVDAATSGNYTYAQATLSFTVTPYEINTIYLTQNVFIYSGNNNVIEVYALGANQEKVVISNKTVTKDGAVVTTFVDAGSYAVSVSAGALSSNPNYTVANTVNTVTFVVNPMSVVVNFGTLANWVFTDGNNPQIVITASVANAVKVQYGKFGTVNQEVADNGSGTFTIAANSMASLIGQRGMISVTAKNGNYQIAGQDFQTFEVVSSASAATAEFKLDGVAWADDNMTFAYGDSATVAVAGSDGVEVKYYKDGVLLNSPITDVASLDAGAYLITVTHSSLSVSSNVNGASRSFTVAPREVDLSSASWVIDGNAVAGNSVVYNGQIYNATLNLGENADDFVVYYTNGASKNVGNVTTTATVVPKNGNYKAVGVVDSYNWTITDVAATVSWNNDGTVASIAGDNAAATGGSFFVKDGASYKVVYKKDGVVLDKAPTEDGDYTAEVVLALGNDGNVKVTANSFSFTISNGSGIGGGDTPVAGGISWWWIALIVIASLALFFAIVAVIIAMKKKAPVAGDDDGFYDDVTDEDLM